MSGSRGWDNTGANGANLSFPSEFGIVDNTWLVGFINSAYVFCLSCLVLDSSDAFSVVPQSLVFLGKLTSVCSILTSNSENSTSAWATDPLNNYLGRRGVIFLSGLL
jgi:hypothetical protein